LIFKYQTFIIILSEKKESEYYDMTEKTTSVIAVAIYKTYIKAVRFTLTDGRISYERIFERETADINAVMNAVREIVSLSDTADSIGFTACDNRFFALSGGVPVPIPDVVAADNDNSDTPDPDFDPSALLEHRMSAEEIYRRTGHILQNDSPLVRFFADRGKHFFDTVLDTPELLMHMLTGTAAAERTAVSAGGMLSLENLDYDRDIELELGLCSYNFPAIVSPGTRIGKTSDINVTAVCNHSIASCLAAAPPDSVCLIFNEDGMWVGVSLPLAPRTELCETYGFSVEAGYNDCFNLIKYVYIREILDKDFVSVTPNAADNAVSAILRIADEIAGITGRHYQKLCIAGECADIQIADIKVAGIPGVEISRVPFDAAAAGNALVQFVAGGHFPDIETARAALYGTQAAESQKEALPV
jgi:hypothetical protein